MATLGPNLELLREDNMIILAWITDGAAIVDAPDRCAPGADTDLGRRRDLRRFNSTQLRSRHGAGIAGLTNDV